MPLLRWRLRISDAHVPKGFLWYRFSPILIAIFSELLRFNDEVCGII